MTLKTYKDIASCHILGVENLPAHWAENKFGYLFELSKGLTITKQDLVDEGIPCLNYGEVHSKYGFEVNPAIHILKCVPESYLQSNPSALLQHGDFVFADTSEDMEGSGNFSQLISTHPTFAGYHTIIARPVDTVFPRFFAYLFHSDEFRNQIRLLVKGVKVFSISQGILKSASVWLPTKNEQQKIAQFLDYETAKIDALIDEQKRLIELLKEKRQAVISHAVTKGLNPDVPMKDSGVEWLGDVPEDWSVCGLTRYLESVVDYRGKTPKKTISGVFLVTARNIKNGIVDYSLSAEYVSLKEYDKIMSRGKPRKGDVLLTMEAPLGEVANVDEENIALAQRVIKLRGTVEKLDNYYLKWMLLSSFVQAQLESKATGSTALGLKGSKVSEILICLPPLAKQRAIAAYIEENCLQFDNLMQSAESLTVFLKERRSALISAAVTGKIDVRDWQPPEDADLIDSNAAVQMERQDG